MSTYSLPRLLGGGGFSSNHKINIKFGTLRFSKSFRERQKQRSKSVARVEGLYDSRKQQKDLYSMLPIPTVNNGRGTVRRNQFRGVRKEEMDRQANMIMHSMTVGNGFFPYEQMYFYNCCRAAFSTLLQGQ